MPDETLSQFRARIDELDDQLIRLLAERFEITKAVGAHKAATGLPAADPGREAEQVARLRAIAEGLQDVAAESELGPEIAGPICHRAIA